jgi:hypothetical protein
VTGGGRARLGWGVAAAAALAAVLGARSIEPDGRGFGTHERLGLPPCAFREAVGAPCPACGLTTAFALAARGRAGEALLAQPFGALLFAAAAILAPVGALAAALGPAPGRRLIPGRAARFVPASVIGLYAASWAFTLTRAASAS